MTHKQKTRIKKLARLRTLGQITDADFRRQMNAIYKTFRGGR